MTFCRFRVVVYTAGFPRHKNNAAAGEDVGASPPCAKVSQHPCTTVKSALRQTQYTGFTAEKQDCSLDVCKAQWIAAAIPAFACVFLFRGIPDHRRLKAQKGRDDVNVFRNRDMLLGVGEAAAFSAA